MRKLLASIPLLLIFLCANPAYAQTVVAKAQGSNSAGLSSISTGTTLNISSGQLVQVTCYAYTDPLSFAASDTSSTNSFTASPDGMLTPDTGAASGLYLETFYAQNTVAKSSDTFTCTFGGGGILYSGINVIQMSGMATVSVLDTHAMGVGMSAGTTLTSGSFTTTGSDIIVASGGWDNVSVACTAGTNFTLQNTNSSGQSCDSTWIAGTSQTGVTATMTIGGSQKWAISVMAYKAAGGGASGHCAACDLSEWLPLWLRGFKWLSLAK